MCTSWLHAHLVFSVQPIAVLVITARAFVTSGLALIVISATLLCDPSVVGDHPIAFLASVCLFGVAACIFLLDLCMGPKRTSESNQPKLTRL